MTDKKDSLLFNFLLKFTMKFILRSILTLLLFSFFSFIQTQASFADSKNNTIQTQEQREIFKELDDILRVFDLGEIEIHLDKLDRTDNFSLGEAYLILSYHNARIGLFKISQRYLEKASVIIIPDKRFEEHPFYTTYNSIINFIKFNNEINIYEKDQIFEAFIDIIGMNPKTSIQKAIFCRTVFDGIDLTNIDKNNLDFINIENNYCSETYDLHYIPTLGQAAVLYDQKKSPKERARLNRKLLHFFDNELTDPYSKLETSFAMFAAGMANRDTSISLRGAIYYRELLEEYELLDTPLHFMSLIGRAGIANLFGNVNVYHEVISQANQILTNHENLELYLKDFELEMIGLATMFLNSYEISFKLSDIAVKQWNEFKYSYDGDWTQLESWTTHVQSLAKYHELKNNFTAQKNILEEFIKLHDKGAKIKEPFNKKRNYPIKYSNLIQEFKNQLYNSTNSSNKYLPDVYTLHQILGDTEYYIYKNDQKASEQYKLAWKRIPPEIKSTSIDGAKVLSRVLTTLDSKKQMLEKQEYSSLLLDTWENILLSTDSPSIISEFERSEFLRDDITSAIFTFAIASLEYEMRNDHENNKFALSEAFRAIQIVRLNRLTKMYKMKSDGTNINDISKLEKLTNLSGELVKSGQELIDNIPSISPILDRSYQLTSLEEMQSKIPWDTTVIIAYEDFIGINFAFVNSFSFDPIALEIDEDDRWRLDAITKSAANPLKPFDYENANWVFSKIFKSNEDILNYKQNIVFLPSKSMFNFPISLLHNGNKIPENINSTQEIYDPNGFLIDNYYISYAADFSNELFSNNDGKLPIGAIYNAVDAKTFFAIADPYLENNNASVMRGISFEDVGKLELDKLDFKSLPETLDEVNAAAKYFKKDNVKILSGKKATKENIISSQLIDYDVLMFSTHGVSPGVIEGFEGAGLLLSLPIEPSETLSFEDALLTPNDILNLKLDADIVILNACNSGLSNKVNAPGLTGLAQSFLVSGSQSVMVSHWPISSVTTKQITKQMFQNIENDTKSSFNQALTNAQLEIKSNPKTQHPFYWAPYNIYGNF